MMNYDHQLFGIIDNSSWYHLVMKPNGIPKLPDGTMNDTRWNHEICGSAIFREAPFDIQKGRCIQAAPPVDALLQLRMLRPLLESPSFVDVHPFEIQI